MIRLSLKKIILISLGILCLVAILLTLRFTLLVFNPTALSGKDQFVVVHEGMTLAQVTDVLQQKGIIKNKSVFKLLSRLNGTSRKIKSGEYVLGPKMTPFEVLEILTRGAIITHSVTIPEGFTNEQIGELLAQKGLVDKEQFIFLTDDDDLIKKYGLTGPNLEGYLYPDTYKLGRGISAHSAIQAMINRFWQMVGPYRTRAKEVGMKLEDVVTLASIVEKETGKGEERPVIASVFMNRLKRNMRLESDPTVIYGLKAFNGNLTRKDLSRSTPYNTYVIRGLPPGPIANPGVEAIKAVLYPAETKYLYFVSRNDGTHHFSKTLREHNRAVEIYQKKRRFRNRKRS